MGYKTEWDITPDSTLENIQFVVYCRKSSDETSGNQKQSIPDQIRSCIEYAKREGIEIAKKPKDFTKFISEAEILAEDMDENRELYQETRDLYIVKEQKSAKTPGIRNKWNEILKGAHKGSIKGILSYSPDRQARNMLEGGELISLVDEGKVDLRYTNFHFENTASGKMMLGIWFVFSKQYADKVGEDVTRGSTSKTLAGKAIGKIKHGYIINSEGFHEPHPEFFPIIKEAFKMKLAGEVDKKIVEYINKEGYIRTYKKSGREAQISEKNIYKLWIDEFYYGFLITEYGDADLRIVSPYYEPIITEQEFEILRSRYEDNEHRRTKTKKRDEYSELISVYDNFLFTEDKHILTFSIPNKHRHIQKIQDAKIKGENLQLSEVVGQHQLHYICGNKKSKYHGWSVTAEDIDNVILAKLKHFKVTEKDVEEFIETGKRMMENITGQNKVNRSKINARINSTRNEENNFIRENLGRHRDKTEEKVYQKAKELYSSKLEALKKDLGNIDSEEKEEFLEVESYIKFFSNAYQGYKNSSNVLKAKISRILFSNIVLDSQKRLHIAVKPNLERLFTLNGASNGTPRSPPRAGSPHGMKNPFEDSPGISSDSRPIRSKTENKNSKNKSWNCVFSGASNGTRTHNGRHGKAVL